MRLFEPKLALIPPDVSTGVSAPIPVKRADTFYPPLLSLADTVGARLVVLEVGNTRQARRVARMARNLWAKGEEGALKIGIWRDGGEGLVGEDVNVDEDNGEGRAVFCFRGNWASGKALRLRDGEHKNCTKDRLLTNRVGK